MNIHSTLIFVIIIVNFNDRHQEREALELLHEEKRTQEEPFKLTPFFLPACNCMYGLSPEYWPLEGWESPDILWSEEYPAVFLIRTRRGIAFVLVCHGFSVSCYCPPKVFL